MQYDQHVNMMFTRLFLHCAALDTFFSEHLYTKTAFTLHAMCYLLFIDINACPFAEWITEEIPCKLKKVLTLEIFEFLPSVKKPEKVRQRLENFFQTHFLMNF